jgi:competence protein ComEC
MRLPLHALAFLAGILWVETRPALAAVTLTIPLVVVVSAVCWRFGVRAVAALGLGIMWSWLRGVVALEPDLPAAANGTNLVIIGDVVSLPEEAAGRVRFEFAPEKRAGVDLPSRVRLSWYGTGRLPGAAERWQLEVRLRSPHGFANPGGYDYEGELFRERIGAIGYVRDSARNRLLGSRSGSYPVLALRAAIVARIERALGESPVKGIIAGLAVGAAQAISSAQWQVFAATGTTHLIAISGLHVTMVAALAMLLARALWRLPRRRAPRSVCAEVICACGAIAATGYAVLAGFSVPTQRTLIMLLVGLAAVSLRRSLPASHVLALALILVLVHDPHAVLTAGFWLSFLTVAAILAGVGSLIEPRPLLRAFLVTQGAVSVALLPATVGLFGAVSLVAPLVNLLAIPLFSVVLVPAILLGLVLALPTPGVADFLLRAAAGILEACWPLLEGAASVPGALIHLNAASGWQIALLALSALIAMCPLPAMLRAPGLLVLLMLTVVTPERPATGDFTLSVLDVGQGSAAVVRTSSHTLLFDAGPSFRSGRSAGELVVVPFLHHAGVRRLDMVIASHYDNDHVGGIAAVERAFGIATLRHGGKAPRSQAPAAPCSRGEAWIWDGVRFEFIHPAAGEQWNDNNGSCVLRIAARGGSALLTGDIEAQAEEALAAREALLPADVIVVPHHGSRSSSTQELVRRLSARFAIASAGAGNRWGFPERAVIDRWCAGGAEVADTANWGAVTVRIQALQSPAPRSERLEHRRYWHATGPLAGRSLCHEGRSWSEWNTPRKQLFVGTDR